MPSTVKMPKKGVSKEGVSKEGVSKKGGNKKKVVTGKKRKEKKTTEKKASKTLEEINYDNAIFGYLQSLYIAPRTPEQGLQILRHLHK